MTDARLVATNPVDSSLVPVSCNSRGELSTQAPKIELIPNDVEINGDLTVTGTINGSGGGGGGQGEKGDKGDPGEQGEPGGVGPPGPQGDPGEGLPLPYAPEGSVLQVVNGAPAWAVAFTPEPEPPASGVIAKNLSRIFDQTGKRVYPENPSDYIQTLPSWNNTGLQNYEGSVTEFWEIKDHTSTETYEFTGSLGKVLTLKWAFKFQLESYDDSFKPWTFEWDNANIVYISDDLPNPVATVPGTDVWIGGSANFLINRDISSSTLKVGKNERGATSWSRMLRFYALEDAGTFAVRRQMEIEKNFKTLRGMTSGIDLSRPTQD